MASLQPATVDAYRLIHEGALTLADMEATGLRIDTAALEGALASTAIRIKALEEKLRETNIFQEWRKAFGSKTNLDSRKQLGHVLFDVMGYHCSAYTAGQGNRASTDEDALEKLNIGFVKGYLKRAKLQKLRGTYLEGLQREVELDGLLHPFFNLHTVETFRSSSDSPNFQNIPIRNPEIGRIIRSCFIAREGCRFVEFDYSTIEVRVAACYSKDPSLIEYVKDKTKDMHRDTAAECFMLPNNEVPKDVRQQVKALFVFAEFYGDYYVEVARSLWEATERHSLTTAAGVPLREHLKQLGIKQPGAFDHDAAPMPGSFEAHIQKVEDRFWNKRFRVYGQWKRDWFEAYKRKGGINTLTGFALQGVYSRNFINNAPIQGSAFHCLLWSLIRINKEAKRRRMRSRLIGQIHDSAIANVYEDELHDFVAMVKQIMTVELVKAWPWIIVPLEVEAEASPLDGSWADKKKINS